MAYQTKIKNGRIIVNKRVLFFTHRELNDRRITFKIFNYLAYLVYIYASSRIISFCRIDYNSYNRSDKKN